MVKEESYKFKATHITRTDASFDPQVNGFPISIIVMKKINWINKLTNFMQRFIIIYAVHMYEKHIFLISH